MKLMTNDLPTKLESIDPTNLKDVVRQDQISPSFEINEWSVRRLSDQGIVNPDGLWLFSGEGYDDAGSRPWSVVLKILTRQEDEPPLNDMWHWKREFFIAKSGLIEKLTDSIKAPRIYKTEERSEGAWLWLEYIKNSHPDPWGLDNYAFVARELGYWNGTRVKRKQLPTEPWLMLHPYRSWYTETDPEQDFKFPLNQKHIVGNLRERYEELWVEREKFYKVSEFLPQTFSHFDSQRRNLFIHMGDNGQDELVLVDWGQCGLGPLGAELNWLIAGSAALFEWPASKLAELDTIDPGPKLIALLLIILLVILGWGFWRYRKYQKNSALFEGNDAVMIGFLLFASFTLGIVLTYFFVFQSLAKLPVRKCTHQILLFHN